MPEFLIKADHSLFLFLNGIHSPVTDPLFFWGTKSLVWLPFYLLLLCFVIRQYGWNTVWILIMAALMITVSDQLSNFFKDWIARPRPSHEHSLTGVHLVNGYKGGLYGFYSAHASSNMALAVYLLILLRHPFRWFPLVMMGYAIFMSYTRIYLGVHYPGDILAGWLAGAVLGWIAGQLCGFLLHRLQNGSGRDAVQGV